MDITRLGKILVFVNLVIALGMGVWAFGLYSGRIEWTSTKPGKGELAKRQATLKELQTALAGAEDRSRIAHANLHFLEVRRPRDQKFFADHLTFLQSGATAQNPAVMVAYQNGQILLEQDGRVRMIPAPYKDKGGQPIQSLAFYEKEQKTLQANLVEAIDQYQKLVSEDVRLTNLIVGGKGLRQQLFDEEDVKQARIKQEMDDLKPVYINAVAESQLLLQRQKALQARKKELETATGRITQR